MVFKTSMDRFVKIVTISITVLFAILIFTQIYQLTREPFKFSHWLPILVLSITPLLTFVFRPAKYSLDNDQLIIHRPAGNVKILLTAIETIEEIDKKTMGMVFRTFGVGGMFGYYGNFYNRTFGSMTWYATRRDRMVLLRLHNKKKIILTPDDPQAFIAALKNN